MNRDQLKKDLIRDEALRLKPYQCSAGKLTIGVGRNIEDNGITHDEAMYLLDNDITNVEADLDSKLPWWRSMDEERQSVIANMCFNLGIQRLLGFTNTLKAMSEGRYQDAAKGMKDSLWAKQVGPRAERLIKIMEKA